MFALLFTVFAFVVVVGAAVAIVRQLTKPNPPKQGGGAPPEPGPRDGTEKPSDPNDPTPREI